MILDQENMSTFGVLPQQLLTYQQPGVMSADRLEGVMRLTPALGRQNSVLVFTTEKIFSKLLRCSIRQKRIHAKASVAIPDIPDRLLAIPLTAW
ncbi:hypothetical protein KCP76_11415 [Salmonella enterica subsp. enterica serovar Weltevreden]|nr:hypothetical protein KCP76_11415 [Salmonella enterica subsp. enterica serovar Weltevreden]